MPQHVGFIESAHPAGKIQSVAHHSIVICHPRKRVITDLIQIRRLGEKKRDENLHFRGWIKSHVFVERQFKRAAEEVHDQIDCRQCAECCRVTEVEITERDIEHLMKYLRIPRKRFMQDYTGTGEDGTLILKRTNEKGCVFLDGNDCTVYDA